MSSISRRNDFFTDSIFNPFYGTNIEPRANVARSKTSVTVEVELPGFSRSDIAVETRGGTLTVTATRGTNKNEYERQEFGSTTTLRRAWSLPREISQDSIDASYDAGILTITLPFKNESAENQRKIEIR